MSWERDPLLAKARLFFGHAFNVPRTDPLFGLWCSLGLELLGRAALASVSPTLLAEPDNDHKHLLHALNRGSDRTGRRSIGTSHVFSLCRTLFPEFTEENLKASIALANRRNDELHTGDAAFAGYQPNVWLAGFYEACRSLTIVLGESLESLFGQDEALVADEMLSENRNDVRQRVQSAIGAHRKVFESKSPEDQEKAKAQAVAQSQLLAFQRHHRVTCAACGAVATVKGIPFGHEIVTHNDDTIVVTQSVAPKSFSCSACGLALAGFSSLQEAKVGGHYTRRTEYQPEDYYGLINPDNFDPSPYIEEYLRNQHEYDNE